VAARPEIAPWFVMTWILLALSGLWFTYFGTNIARKKRLIPFFIIGSGALFIVFVLLMIGDVRVLLFMVPAVVLICLLNLRMIRVCSVMQTNDSCGSRGLSSAPSAVHGYNSALSYARSNNNNNDDQSALCS
jgi:hypothetical protein